MAASLQLGHLTLTSENFIPVLTRYKLVPQLLCESIIDSAIASIVCTPEETAQACEEFCQTWNLASELDQQRWRSRYQLTQNEFEQLATRSLRIEKFKEATWGHKLQSYFLKNKPRFDQVAYSLIRTTDPDIANELYFRIFEGEQTFAAVARHYSEGPEAETDGFLGLFELDSLNPDLARQLYTAPVGEVQFPEEFGEWYIILRVEQKIPAQFDQTMRQRLLDENFEIWFHEQLIQLPEHEQIWMGVKPNQQEQWQTDEQTMDNLAA